MIKESFLADHVVALEGQAPAPDTPLTLWYRQPAADWNHALPVGNGRLGGMVFGGVNHERIQLNEDTIWSGGPIDMHNPEALENLDAIRQALFNGNLTEANRLGFYKFIARPVKLQPYQPLGDLWLEMSQHTAVSDYRRELDLDSGIARVTYRAGDATYTREIFASAPAQTLVVRLSCDQPGRIDCRATLQAIAPVEPDPRSKAAAQTWTQKLIEESGSDPTIVDQMQTMVEYFTYMPEPHATRLESGLQQITLHGQADNGKGVRFQAVLRATVEGGSVTVEDGWLDVTGADALTLVLVAATDFGGKDPATACVNDLSKSVSAYADLRAEHITDYQSLFHRLSLDLGHDEALQSLPTDERLQRVRDGGEDHGLVTCYLQFARYLMIAASRPGSQAMNLQGIWNGQMRPPWNSAYTININTQMNYWPAETLNLAECHEPLFDLIEALVSPGQQTAQRMYGARGFVAHHNTDLWRHTVPVDGIHSGLWPTGAAWLALHYGYHYDHSLDRAFLERAYPVVKEAAIFFIDYLAENASGQWVTGPSISPENTYILPDGTRGQLCMGPAMDSQIVRELLTDCIRFSQLLGIDNDLREELRAIRARLPQTKIGRHGQIMEWAEDWDEAEPGHRHFSHLFAVYPGTQISPRHTPELAQAARVTLERRLTQGGGHTGWSRAWMMNVYARLLEAETAYQNVLALLRQSTLPNLFDNHPPFQIDGNFGGAAGISEMLLQSHEDEIALLPALPAPWDTGSLRGFRARNGISLEMTWDAGHITNAHLHASATTMLTLRPPAGQEVVEIYNAGQIMSFIAGEGGTARLEVTAGETYQIILDEQR